MQKDEWKTDPAEALGQIRLLLENLQTNIEECNKQRKLDMWTYANSILATIALAVALLS